MQTNHNHRIHWDSLQGANTSATLVGALWSKLVSPTNPPGRKKHLRQQTGEENCQDMGVIHQFSGQIRIHEAEIMWSHTIKGDDSPMRNTKKHDSRGRTVSEVVIQLYSIYPELSWMFHGIIDQFVELMKSITPNPHPHGWDKLVIRTGFSVRSPVILSVWRVV